MEELSQDIIVILSSSIFLLLITLFIVFLLMAYKRRDKSHILERKMLEENFNNQLLQSQIEIQEQTFQQIGKELHDNVGQLLSTSRMLIGLTERNLQNPPDTLRTANITLGDAINELRSLSRSLDKEWLSQFSFIDNLKTEIARVNTGNTIKASLNDGAVLGLSPAKQIVLFRIVQEAMQNAVKHSRCRYLSIDISKTGDATQIVISDDGAGFTIPEESTGMGLMNMQHRTQLLGGHITWQAGSDGKGTVVSISIPENKDTV